MILVDANLLLYAYNQDSPRHAVARVWLEREISSGRPVRLALVTLLAFVRIGSDSRVFSEPLTSAEACGIVQTWLEAPNVQMLAPGPRTWTHLAKLCDQGQAKGALVMDAHLAALALEHGAVVASTDRDFDRFDGIKKINPLLGGRPRWDTHSASTQPPTSFPNLLASMDTRAVCMIAQQKLVSLYELN